MLHSEAHFLVHSESPPFLSLVRLWPLIEPISFWAHDYVQKASRMILKCNVGQETCCDGRVSHTQLLMQLHLSFTEIKKTVYMHTEGFCKI